MAPAYTNVTAEFDATAIGTITNLATLGTHADWDLVQEDGEQRKSSGGNTIYVDRSGRSVYSYNAHTPASADYAVRLTGDGRFADTGDIYVGVAARLKDTGDPSTWDGYVLWFFDDYSASANSVFDIQRFVDGSGTSIATSAGSQTFADGDTMELEVTGTGATVTLKAYKNGSEVISTSDSNAARIVGTGIAGTFGYTTNTNAPYWDNWKILEAAAGADIPWYYRAQQEAVA